MLKITQIYTMMSIIYGVIVKVNTKFMTSLR